MTTKKSITVYQSYVPSGAPGNAAGPRTGLGRTVSEAEEAAGHWANQAPFARSRKISVVDGYRNHERLVWDFLLWIEGEFLPPTPRGKRILDHLRAHDYATALIEFFEACDQGEQLVAGGLTLT